MGAHLRDLDSVCQRCGAQAKVELFNTFNALIGKFCRRHGRTALAKQLEAEGYLPDEAEAEVLRRERLERQDH